MLIQNKGESNMFKKILVAGAIVMTGCLAAEADVTSKTYVENTYAKKSDMNVTDSGTGYVKTVTQANGKITVVKENVKIPVNSASGAPTASIWVQ